jgi:hypothetical protein
MPVPSATSNMCPGIFVRSVGLSSDEAGYARAFSRLNYRRQRQPPHSLEGPSKA